MLSLYHLLSLRYLRLRRTRAVLIVFSIALGVATWVATGALIHSLEKEIRVAATPLRGFADLYVSNGSDGVRQELVARVALVPGVRAVEPVILEHVVLPELLPDRTNEPALLLGYRASESRAGGANAWGITWQPSASVNPLALLAARPAAVGVKLGPRLALDRGGCFRVLAAGKSHRLLPVATLSASGPAATLGGNVIAMRLEDAAAVLGRPGLVSRLDVQLEPDADRDAVRQRLEAELAGRGHVATPESQDQRIRNLVLGLEIGFSLSGAVALVVGMFLVYNSLAVSVAERRHDIGIMRSLGATRGQVRGLFLGEAMLLGLAGTALGIPLGLGLAELALGPMQQALRDIFLPMRAEHIDLGGLGRTVTSAVLAGLATAVLAALIPSARAAAEEPADAVRRVPPSPGPLLRVLHLGGCLLLAAAGLGLIGLKGQLHHLGLTSRFGAYTGLAVLFLGCLLATPFFTALAARFLQPAARRLLPVEARLASDNLVRSPGRTGLVIGALAAGVALMFHTAGLIRSNEVAIIDWVDDTIRADAFITSGGPLSGSGEMLEMSDDVLAQLRRQFGADPDFQVVPVCFRRRAYLPPGRRPGEEVELFIVALDAETYAAANASRNYRTSLLPLMERLAREPGAAVASDNFLAKHGLAVGDTVTVTGADGPVNLRVIGSVVDYSWNEGTLYVDRAQFAEDFNTRLVSVLDCYLPAGLDAATFRKEVQTSSWGAEHALFVLPREELRENILGMIRRLYGLAYTQQTVVVIVIALGVTAALLISVLQRRRELGLLRAVGATQPQVLHSVLAEAVLMGLIGTALGLFIGVPLEWYVVHELMFEEAGFRMPVVYPWLASGLIAGAAVALAALAGLVPAVQAGRLRIAEAIAYE